MSHDRHFVAKKYLHPEEIKPQSPNLARKRFAIDSNFDPDETRLTALCAIELLS